ncbi:MAG TPA: thiamine pyrophosphate-dependent enzyme, partial [Rhodanobacteraceae bacterium]|nr:thiamine pyrophosphate-dependent enzyme [Rhodanobacteraceae bacterium]
RYFDRITRPEQIMDALPRALAVLHDPATCGPATLAFCQDVQAEAHDYPAEFFAPRLWSLRRPGADADELDALVDALRQAQRPLLIAGGGVLYSGAETALARFAEEHGVAVAETQAGKGAMPWDHPLALGSIGVTGSSAANAAAERADLVVGIGTRLGDFTTGSRSLFAQARLVQVNVQACDAHKHAALAVVGDARRTLEDLQQRLVDWRAPDEPCRAQEIQAWQRTVDAATSAEDDTTQPSDAEVIGRVQAAFDDDAVVVCAAGGLPGELHKLWRCRRPDGYHLEYGYSCMGYEIAGGLGVKMAVPDREVVVMVGDGSYLMLNSELATSVMLGRKLVVVVLDNRGFGCIDRLQHATGGAGFNNLLEDTEHAELPAIDFAAHAASLGAHAERVGNLGALSAALARARNATTTSVVVIETNPRATTEAGGWWWDVAVPEVSTRTEVTAARRDYEAGVRRKRDRT